MTDTITAGLRTIRARRENLGWSISALARAVGLDRATVTKIENGTPGVRPEKIGVTRTALDQGENSLLGQSTGIRAVSAPPGLVRYRTETSADGLAVTVTGPANHADGLLHTAIRLTHTLRTQTHQHTR